MPFRAEYDKVIAAVESSGFYVTGMPMDSGGDRIVCASRLSSDGLTGNSFWIAERRGKWFLGTWGGLLYQLADADCASAISVAWLRRNQKITASDIDTDLKEQFGLVPAEHCDVDAR